MKVSVSLNCFYLPVPLHFTVKSLANYEKFSVKQLALDSVCCKGINFRCSMAEFNSDSICSAAYPL